MIEMRGGFSLVFRIRIAPLPNSVASCEGISSPEETAMAPDSGVKELDQKQLRFFSGRRDRKTSTMALRVICLSMACYVIDSHVPFRHPRVTGNAALTGEEEPAAPLFAAVGTSAHSPMVVPRVSPPPCSHIYSGRGPRGHRRQGAKRAHFVASSGAQSLWVLAV